MVSKEEIGHVSELMRIKVDDYEEYVDKVHAMIDYFDILDSAGVESEEIPMREIRLSALREDEHMPFNEDLMDRLHNRKGRYVRAPKMS